MPKTQDSIENVVVIGDRVLVRPKKQSEKTEGGLYLPPGVHKKEKIHSGYIIKAGPGYPVPLPSEGGEPWQKDQEKENRYVSLQAQEGDLAVYLKKKAHEIQIDKEKYVVLPHNAILLLFRDEGLFE